VLHFVSLDEGLLHFKIPIGRRAILHRSDEGRDGPSRVGHRRAHFGIIRLDVEKRGVASRPDHLPCHGMRMIGGRRAAPEGQQRHKNEQMVFHGGNFPSPSFLEFCSILKISFGATPKAPCMRDTQVRGSAALEATPIIF
jgi:hypothetical protein